MKLDEFREHLAFWLFGMANSFAFIVMLTAAQDIMEESDETMQHMLIDNKTELDTCKPVIESHECTVQALGPVLLANILPAFLIKMTFPFFMHKIPFSVLHILVCLAQATSYLLVAFSTTIEISLFGVMFAALSSGLGDICYLALASHYNKKTISSWASGTGGSGILGSLSYAVLTEPRLADLNPQTALLLMLAVPVLFFFTYFLILTPAPTVYSPTLFKPSTWLVPKSQQRNLAHNSDSIKQICQDTESQTSELDLEKKPIKSHKMTVGQRLKVVWQLKKYIIPLTTVYFADYLVNQGLVSLLVFDCDHGFGLSRDSQYRWYQVIYCMGAFIARSTANFLHLPFFFLILFPVYEIANAIFFFTETLHYFIPHISVVFLLVFIEGMIGGASYANTYFRIHSEVDPSVKEFSLSITTMSDVIGIAAAGVSTLPIHSIVCGYNARISR